MVDPGLNMFFHVLHVLPTSPPAHVISSRLSQLEESVQQQALDAMLEPLRAMTIMTTVDPV